MSMMNMTYSTHSKQMYVTSREVNESRRPHTCSTPCAFEEKKTLEKNTKTYAPPKIHYEIHSSPATATTSRRPTTKHIPHVSPYSPASIDPGLVEIGLVQLTQAAKTTNFNTRRQQTDEINFGTLYAARY